jgi:hypothetical protein
MKSSEKRFYAEPLQDAADPYRGVPLGVEAAWWPQSTIVGAHEALARPDLDPSEWPDRARPVMEVL